MDAKALADKLRNARATASADDHFRKQRAAAEEERQRRHKAAGEKADQVIAEVLEKLDGAGHQAGMDIEVMRTDGDEDAANMVFNRLMEAAQSNVGEPCWYPVRDREVDMCDDHYGVIKLRYGVCPDQPDPCR